MPFDSKGGVPPELIEALKAQGMKITKDKDGNLIGEAMGGTGGLPGKYGDPVKFRFEEERPRSNDTIVPGFSFKELKNNAPPEGPEGQVYYKRLDGKYQYTPVEQKNGPTQMPQIVPANSQLFPDGSKPEHEGMTIFRREIFDINGHTTKYNIEFWQRSWAHRGSSLVLIQLRKSKVGSIFSYGQMWYKPSTNRGRFCNEWVRRS